MKRRILTILLAGVLTLSLAACGGKNAGGNSDQPDNSVSDGSAAPDAPSAPAGAQPDGTSPDASLPESGGADAPDPEPGEGPDPAGTDIKLTLNRTNIELNKAGATFKLRYTVEPDVYDGLAVFTSSDVKVATVDETDGTIKAVGPGKAVITVKYDGATATASVNCNWKEEADKPDTSDPPSIKPGVGPVVLPGFPSVVPGDGPSDPAGEPSAPADESPASGGEPSAPADEPDTPDDTPNTSANVDLSAFYSSVTGKYEFAMLEQADDGILDMFYAGMSGISTEQRLIYICAMSMNTGEFGLVQVKDGKDVDAVKRIFQARIDAQAGGGAWYPQAVESWTNNSRVVSNGNYVMMIVHENCDDIVKEFHALF